MLLIFIFASIMFVTLFGFIFVNYRKTGHFLLPTFLTIVFAFLTYYSGTQLPNSFRQIEEKKAASSSSYNANDFKEATANIEKLTNPSNQIQGNTWKFLTEKQVAEELTKVIASNQGNVEYNVRNKTYDVNFNSNSISKNTLALLEKNLTKQTADQLSFSNLTTVIDNLSTLAKNNGQPDIKVSLIDTDSNNKILYTSQNGQQIFTAIQ